MRSSTCPPGPPARANSHTYNAFSTWPRWRYPVGAGANLVTMGTLNFFTSDRKMRSLIVWRHDHAMDDAHFGAGDAPRGGRRRGNRVLVYGVWPALPELFPVGRGLCRNCPGHHTGSGSR